VNGEITLDMALPTTPPRRDRTADGRRWAAGFGSVLVFAATTLVVLTGPAGATTQPAFHAKVGSDTQQSYGPIPIQSPLSQVQDPVPSDCTAPGYCDVVPIDVETPPGYNPIDYYLTVKVSVGWTSQTFDNPAQPVQQNDLDIYLYDAKGDKQVNKSASSANPELASTEQTKFLLLVNNFSGANTGYTVKAHVTFEKIEVPSEAPLPIRPGGSGSSFGGASTGTGGGGSSFGSSGSGTSPGGGGSASAPGFTPVSGTPTYGAAAGLSLVPGGDLADVALGGDQLAGLGGGRAGVPLRRAASTTSPAPFVLILWLVVLPVAILGGAGAWLVRRSPTAIRL
jgi:uncharacterized membrane protein YgcG